MAFLKINDNIKLSDLNLTDAFTNPEYETDPVNARIEGMFLWELCKCNIPMTEIFNISKDNSDRTFALICINYSKLTGISAIKLSELSMDSKLYYKGTYTDTELTKLKKVYHYLRSISYNKDAIIKELKEYFKSKRGE